MARNEFLKPARPGLLIRDPRTMEPLPEGGAEVAMTPYWLRRIIDGDVTVAKRPAAKKEA